MANEDSTKQERISKSIPIGWQGLQFDLPGNWNFIAESGTPKEGLIRVTSPHANVEIKWGKVTNPKKFSPESVKTKLFEKLKKSDRKLTVTTRKTDKLLGHDCIYFDLKSDYKGSGVIWFCDHVKKMFIALLTAAPEHFKQSVLDFEGLIHSLRCHVDEAWTRWGVFGFSFKAPSKFELLERRFYVGHGTISLSTLEAHLLRKEETQALLQYWGAANVSFENAHSNMKEWFEDFYQNEFRKQYGRKITMGRFRRTKINGHDATIVKGVFKKGRLNTRTNHCGICMWFCPITNRVYALTLSKTGYQKYHIPTRRTVQFPSPVFDRMVSSVCCH